MKSWKSNSAFVGLLALLMVLGACAKPATSGGNYTADRNVDTNDDDDGGDDTGNVNMRVCENELDTTTGKISEFFDVLVRGGFQGAPTYCLGVEGFGEEGNAAFRVEYEDDRGIREVTFRPDQIVSFKFTTEQAVTSGGSNGYAAYYFRVIFRDDYGLVRFSASTTKRSTKAATAGDTLLSGKIRYYNLPSYETALQEAVAERRRKCQTKEWTTAQCYGYSSPKPWWEEDTTLSEREYAEKIFTENNGANTKVLSNVSIEVDDMGDMDFVD